MYSRCSTSPRGDTRRIWIEHPSKVANDTPSRSVGVNEPPSPLRRCRPRVKPAARRSGCIVLRCDAIAVNTKRGGDSPGGLGAYKARSIDQVPEQINKASRVGKAVAIAGQCRRFEIPVRHTESLQKERCFYFSYEKVPLRGQVYLQ